MFAASLLREPFGLLGLAPSEAAAVIVTGQLRKLSHGIDEVLGGKI